MNDEGETSVNCFFFLRCKVICKKGKKALLFTALSLSLSLSHTHTHTHTHTRINIYIFIYPHIYRGAPLQQPLHPHHSTFRRRQAGVCSVAGWGVWEGWVAMAAALGPPWAMAATERPAPAPPNPAPPVAARDMMI